MPEVVLVKLGGSLITDKRRERTVRRADLARLAAEISASRSGTRRKLLLGHGSGSFGHVAAARSRIHKGLRSSKQLPGVTRTQAEAADLHRIVLAALEGAGVPCFSIAPSSAIVTSGGRPVRVTAEPLELALRRGLVPVTYGDVVLDREQGVAICSTETAVLAFARRLRRAGLRLRTAYWFGDTAGVLDPDGMTIARIRRADRRRLTGLVGGAAATDVTGGMRHRLDTTLALARLGITSWILDGRVPGLAQTALGGSAVPGTRVGP